MLSVCLRPPGRTTGRRAPGESACGTATAREAGGEQWAEERQAAEKFAGYLVAENRGEIGRADAKASVLLGLLGGVAAVVAGAAAAHTGFGSLTAGAAAPLWWLGALLLSVSLLHLLLALVPRGIGRSEWIPGAPMTYFGDVLKMESSANLHEAVRAAGGDPLPALVAALEATSRIVVAKHNHVRIAVACLGLGSFLVLGALLMS